MKSLINRIGQFFFRYRKLIKMIDRESTMKNAVKSVFGALLLSLFMLLLPVLVIVNMFIISKLTIFLSIFLLCIVLSWPFLYYYIYYALLKNYHPKIKDINTNIPYWTESIIISVILLFVGITVLSVVL